MLPLDGRTPEEVTSLVAAVTGAGQRPAAPGRPGAGHRHRPPGAGRCPALGEAHQQAQRALRVGQEIHGEAPVTHFDQLGVFRLLSLIPDSTELRSYVDEVLGPLADAADPDSADLRETLRVLLETNLNVAESARRLHFHYNTMRYRIGKLERMLGPFTSDPTLRLNLLLALHAARMRGLDQPHRPPVEAWACRSCRRRPGVPLARPGLSGRPVSWVGQLRRGVRQAVSSSKGSSSSGRRRRPWCRPAAGGRAPPAPRPAPGPGRRPRPARAPGAGAWSAVAVLALGEDDLPVVALAQPAARRPARGRSAARRRPPAPCPP